MAVYTYDDAYVALGGINISDHVASLALDVSIEPLAKTAMGSATHAARPGLSDWSAEIEFRADFAASQLDAILAEATDNELAVEFRAVNTTVAATNPRWSGIGLALDYSPLMGAVGDQAEQTLSLIASTALTRSDEPRLVTLAEAGGRVSVNPVTGQLAFDRLTGSFFEVYTANADGSSVACLSCGRGDLPTRHIGNPVWSPDGNWLVMQAQAAGASWDSLATPGIGVYNYLYAYDVVGDTAYQIHTVPLTFPPSKGLLHAQFNHAGDKLMWAEMTDGSGGFNGTWKIVIADWDAGTHTLSNLTDYTPDSKTFYETHGWSPDDSKIIYSAAAGSFADLDIWTWDLSGTPTNLTNDVAGAWDEHAHFSRDGKWIAWMSSRGQSFSPLQTDWWLMDVNGENKRQLTRFNDPASDDYQGYDAIAADCDWSLDGRIVGYVQETGTSPDSGRLLSVDAGL